MEARTSRIDVGILGATGMVGQQFVRLLAGHPWFRPSWFAASERSEGKRYSDAAAWRLAGPPPDEAAGSIVQACVPDHGPRLVFSALDAAAAKDLEPEFARAGHIVISNARSWRMEPDAPLLVPEVNADHLALVDRQRRQRGWQGAIVTNPNCATVVLTMVLGPLRPFGLRSVIVSTLQAVSGAGYPGVASLDIVGNVIPRISGEEEKIESETQKVLGTLEGQSVRPHPLAVSAHTNRVPVVDGHTETLSIALDNRPSPEEVRSVLDGYRGRPQALGLPSAPEQPIVCSSLQDRPQPRLDSELGGGMTVTVGRIRRCPVMDIKLVALGHNTIRGAAGAAILNAELMAAERVVDFD
jgi:aspartate-semialdehyde dehydrogenase